MAESSSKHKHTKLLRCMVAAGAFLLTLVISLLMWGGYWLEAVDPLPARADAAVVLEGSWTGERLRIDEAMKLLRQGVPQRVLLPVPDYTYWGDPQPPMARRYLETNYGSELAAKVDFCDMNSYVDSTFHEAHALGKCIKERHWRSVIVVTSNYHTRRAGVIWRRVMAKDDPAMQIWIHGTADPDFQPDGWWRKRVWAKTWLLESTKLFWTATVGR